MMELMEYVAIITGLLIGWWTFRKFINVIIGVLIFTPYHSKPRFDYLYSLADDRITYEVLGNSKIKSYVEYLRIHEASKKSAYKYFIHHYTEIIKVIIIKVAPRALMPAILFWTNWYWYILGVILSIVLSIIYRLHVDNYGIGFYQKSMIIMIMNQYMKESDIIS